MPVTTLDERTALVSVELQAGTVRRLEPADAALIVGNAVALVDAFRASSLPVVRVAVDGGAPGRTDSATT